MLEGLPVIEAESAALEAMQKAEKELEEIYERGIEESRSAYTLVRDDP
jgi:hypothetical protein